MNLACHHWRFALAILLLLGIAHFARADEKADDLSRLQGTWKKVGSDYRGQHSDSVKLEQIWIFSGKLLYTSFQGFEPDLFEFEIDPKSDPKALDMRMRVRNAPRDIGAKRAGYRFVGENLEVVTTRTVNTRPTSFDTVANDGDNSVSIFKRISKDTKIPENVLRSLENDPPLHSKNQQAEAALLKFYTALFKTRSVEEIEPLVVGGKAKELLDVLGPLPEQSEKLAEEEKLLCVRDAEIGERFYHADGRQLVVADTHRGSEKTILVVLLGRRELDFFLMSKEQGNWKVDVTNLIEYGRTPGNRVFGGIRFGMNPARVHELACIYQKTAKTKSFEFLKRSDAMLMYSWDGGKGLSEHTFRFANGKLVAYDLKTPDGRITSLTAAGADDEK